MFGAGKAARASAEWPSRVVWGAAFRTLQAAEEARRVAEREAASEEARERCGREESPTRAASAAPRRSASPSLRLRGGAEEPAVDTVATAAAEDEDAMDEDDNCSGVDGDSSIPSCPFQTDVMLRALISHSPPSVCPQLSTPSTAGAVPTEAAVSLPPGSSVTPSAVPSAAPPAVPAAAPTASRMPSSSFSRFFAISHQFQSSSSKKLHFIYTTTRSCDPISAKNRR